MTGIPALTCKSAPNGAHDRARTGEPLPYQGSALPTELRGLSRMQPTRGLEKVHIVKGTKNPAPAVTRRPESFRRPKFNVCSTDDNDLLMAATISYMPYVVVRGGFEPPKATPADLQSAPFGRSGTSPWKSPP